MKIVYSDSCLEFSQPGHPESVERVRSSYDFLKDKYQIVPPGDLDESILSSVHSELLIEAVRGNSFTDPDCPNYKQIFHHALTSARAAATAAEIALEGETSFSLMRPPGHHAGRDSLGGFCYFNNVAVAAAGLLKKGHRVAIVDFDVHHGNGTQDIFLGSTDLLYVSLHQSPWYPGSGISSEKNCLNFPLEAGTDGESFLETFAVAVEEVVHFDPDVLAVSAGFDAYREDPLGGLELKQTTYEEIGKCLKGLNKPTFAVLEGGYSPDLKRCIDHFLGGID
jgi:acetoin utilization deacetylase AcuC-like enzyme